MSARAILRGLLRRAQVDLNDVPGPLNPDEGGTGLTSYTTGDILYASGGTTLMRLADVATGNAVLSGGVGAAPAYGKVGLTTHVTGALPIANGGTNATSASDARTSLGLGTIATQAANNVAITGGAIDGTTVGATTRAAVRCTTLDASGNIVLGDNAADTLTVTTNALVITAAGEVTMPLQPAFQARVGSGIADVTGDGTTYTLIATTETFDQGSDYNTSTGQYTSPVTAKHWFGAVFELAGMTALHTLQDVRLITSNRNYQFLYANLSALLTSAEIILTGAALADMDAGDLAHINIIVNGSTKTVDIGTETKFYGHLAC